MSCETIGNRMKPMVKKLKLMPLFQELKGRAEISDRHPASTGTGFYLMQLREQAGRATQPRVRLMISVTADETHTPADPVKINHVHITAEATPPPSPAAQNSAVKMP